MEEYYSLFAIVFVVVIAFIGGYFLVSVLIQFVQNLNKRPKLNQFNETNTNNKKNTSRKAEENFDSDDTKENQDQNRWEETGSHVCDEKYYQSVLGIDSQTTMDEIKLKYRILASQYHPDKVAHLGTKLQDAANIEIQKINEAYAYFKRKPRDI